MTTVDAKTVLKMADLEERILDLIRQKHINFAYLARIEDEAGIPRASKPNVEQLEAVVSRLERL